MKTVFLDQATGEIGIMQERGFIDFLDENGRVYDGAIVVEGTPSELRYKKIGEVKTLKEFLDMKKQALH